MTETTLHPKLYHITHVRNIPQIIKSGKLWSDAKRLELQFNCALVGMSHIKQRRLQEIQVGCHSGTYVGEYVPFYFCPRSIMLYIPHKGNTEDLEYGEGQRPIVHLECDMLRIVSWAESQGKRWAFTNCNAGAYYATFYNSLEDLKELNWNAIRANQWSDPAIKDGKQAELLLEESLPWELIERIGVIDTRVQQQLRDALTAPDHLPEVAIKPTW